MKISLRPLGKVNTLLLEGLATSVNKAFGCPVDIGPGVVDIHSGYDPRRKQYSSTVLLALLDAADRQPEEKVVGVAEVDIFAQGLNFVFGVADAISETAMISLARLNPEYNGLPPDEDKLAQRALKEIVHELGHTFGLVHCSDMKCVMHFSNALPDTDWKEATFCKQCQPRLKIRDS